jgi:hypothetical protein
MAVQIPDLIAGTHHRQFATDANAFLDETTSGTK